MFSLRSTESPSNSNDGINDSLVSPHAHQNTPPLPKTTQYHDDSDFEVEVELPSLDKVIPKEMLKKLKPKDKKRQDVLNGEFFTVSLYARVSASGVASHGFAVTVNLLANY